MRCTIYLGTRTCPQAIKAALREHLGPLTILVIMDPKLLGEHNDDARLREELPAIASILEEQAHQQACKEAEQTQRDLAEVFKGSASAPAERITTHATPQAGEERLHAVIQDRGIDHVFVSRDALDILQRANLDPRTSLPDDVELVAV